MAKSGKVYLVGAGVCGKEMLTLRAAELIAEADVVIYDRLVHESVLGLCNGAAEKAYMGKRPGEGPEKQQNIIEMMISEARKGRIVVRLKAGDPFIFGRGGEEMLALREASVEVEAVPGLTSATAIPTLAGIPLTMRGKASSVLILTGHKATPYDEEYFKAHAKFGGTIVLLMSMEMLGTITKCFMDNGMPGQRPAAVISCGNGGSSAIIGTVADIAERVTERRPSVLVIGEVVDMAVRA